MKNHNSENMGYVVFLSAVAALGGFLFGYDTAVISGTIKGVSAQFRLDDIETGWYVGCALIGSIAGVLMAGKLSDRYGRKPVLLFSAVMFASSAIGCMLSSSVDELVVYRIVGGVGVGIASIISPLYISEISVARYRGRLVALYQLAITVGIVGSYFANAAVLRYSLSASFDGYWLQMIFVTEVWRAMLGMEVVPALLFFIILFFIPESPRWLVINRQEERARAVMSRLFGVHTAGEQIGEIRSLVRTEAKSDWRLLLQPGFRTVLFVGISLAMLGQFMGVNAVLYYGPVLFEEAGLAQNSSLDFQIMVGLVNVFSTVLAMWLIDRIGRKKLIYIGVSGMIVTLVGVSIYFMLNTSVGQLSPFLLLGLIMAYIFCCAISICAVIFVLLSEMYPVKVRGAAMSIAGFSLWIGTYLIGQLTPWLLTNLAPSGVFLLFACMCVPYLLITWKLVPETTGRSLEEIEQMIAKK
ncbi:sugar porter family MFS transporter [Parabacteroides johnsonii]|uniref:sugar porter family MFS transporter n=1 Tax=Parabacteroides johnsonii TaxID=387661 RepID=UPI00266C3B0B|nr:sugar porter family MFS transporter [Parabacteroides johnsonii]